MMKCTKDVILTGYVEGDQQTSEVLCMILKVVETVKAPPKKMLLLHEFMSLFSFVTSCWNADK